MKRYLSSAQVADYLGKSRDALNALIRSGDFVAPDAVIGDRFQGWSTETVELARQEMEGGNNVLCNAYGAAELITAIRADAELVRAYGGRGDDAQSGIVLTVPATLHVLAARLENEVRSIIVASQVYTRAAAVRLGHPAEANHLVQTSIPMDFTSLDSVLAPADTDDLLRATNLRLVATSLTDIIAALPSELQSPVTRQVMAALAVERDKILDHARVLDGADDLLSPPVGPDVSVSPAVREAVSERLPGGITLAGPDSTD